MLLLFARPGSKLFRACWAGEGNYKYDELVAEADLLISIGALSDLPLCCTSGVLAVKLKKQQHRPICMFTSRLRRGLLRLDPKTGKLKVADRSCFYMRLNAGLTEADASILEQAGQVSIISRRARLPGFVRVGLHP